MDWAITSLSCDPSSNGFLTANNETDYVLGRGGGQVAELAQEADGWMKWQRTYVYAGSTLIATYDPNPDSPHQPMPSFRLTDWLGTMRASTDSSGVLQSTCTGLPFGDQSACQGNVTDPRYFTGKERDSESGNDYFGARYYASSMGRMLSPDPGNIGVDRTNPQTWNMYSYGLNNPLRVIDPTGLYVCEDSWDCKSQNDQNFAKSLADAQTAVNNMAAGADRDAAQRAIDAYGAQGVDNGVNVRFDSNITGGVTEVSGVANGQNDSQNDNPNKQNINVTFNPNAVGGDPGGGLVAHEGSHVADGSDWVSSGFSASMDPTHNLTEVNANHLQFNIMNAQYGAMYPNGYTANLYGGSVNWKNGDTFKMITPDLQKAIQKENGSWDQKPAFTKGWRLQP